MFTTKDLIKILEEENIPYTKNGNKGVIIDQSVFNNEQILKQIIRRTSDDNLPTLVIKGLPNNTVSIEATNI